MTRIHNFSAGPSTLPEEVLKQAREELLDWQGHGVSIMEVSHRGPLFGSVINQAEQDLRELLNIADNYHVLFMQGGAATQFAAVPLNLLGESGRADMVHTGHWSGKAIEEARRYGTVSTVASSESLQHREIPAVQAWNLDPGAAYLHYTDNETIGGLAFNSVPEIHSVPLVADMSSNILSCPVDINRFGLVYASAQKNMGAAGLTLVVVRDDLLGRAKKACPSALNYQQLAHSHSMFNTPPTFAIYLTGLVLQWVKRQGGIAAMQRLNQRKAARLYETIDQSNLYSNPVAHHNRSQMNVPFFLADERLNDLFLSQAEQAGLFYLKGHRAQGGMRASLYNAVTLESVETLVNFMTDFAQRHGQ